MRRRGRGQLDIPFRRYVFDSSALIELERAKQVKQLRDPGESVWVPERVAKEIDQPGSPLRSWIRGHPDVKTRFETTEERALYVRLIQQKDPRVDDGEAMAIAIAARRKAVLVTNDGASEEKAREYEVCHITHAQFLSAWWRTRRGPGSS